ncbi:MAG: tol-pal system protein YbgF [Rhodospirillales bacterium]
MRFAVCFVTGLILAVAAVQPAAAQSQDDLRVLLERLQRLERDVRTLNIQIARGSAGAQTGTAGADAQALAEASGGDNRPAQARLEVRLAELEKDLRAATGQMENMTFRIREVAETVETLTNDMTFRLDALEKAQAEQAAAMQAARTAAPAPAQRQGKQPEAPFTPAGANVGGQPVGEAAAPGAAAKQPVSPGAGGEQAITGTLSPGQAQEQGLSGAASAPTTTAMTPEDQYKQAFGLLRQSRYGDAETALKGFLGANGRHKLASNAHYWLGETYYVRGLYLEAARTFLAGYEAAPGGAKAPDALLKLGMSLGGLQHEAEACDAFDKLEREFPSPAPGIAGALAREKQRYECP